jgi:beta-lactam-binding protein with PASTA domain
MWLKGEYRDRLYDLAGRELAASEPACNVVVYRTLDLIARLLSNEPGMRGILFWAVGSGDPSWDANPKTADRNTTSLVHEIFRKPLDLERDVFYDADTHRLTVRVIFEPDEAVGTLREFGLFGGNASPLADSGYLLNYRIHPALEKSDENSLERTLHFTFSPERMPVPLINLIGELLANTEGLKGIQYCAVGVGQPEWDTKPPAKNLNASRLVNETFRKRVDTAPQIRYLAETHTLLVRVSFAFNEAEQVSREFGLFGGNATDEPNTGYLINYETHTAISKDVLEVLEREFQLTLGSGVDATVPELLNRTLDEVRARLDEAGLALGDVRDVEGPEPESLESSIEPHVVEQQPAPGENVPEGTTVNVTLSSPPKITVPELSGLTFDEARDILSAERLLIRRDEQNVVSSNAPGTIAFQFPSSGTGVRRGTPVTVRLARPVLVPVPDLVGSSPAEAAIILEQSQLVLAPAPFPVRQGQRDWDTVVEQNPVAGDSAPKGSSVVITVAAPHTVEVPNIVGLQPENAATTLRAVGVDLLAGLKLPSVPTALSLGTQLNVESLERVGQVIGQDPVARTSVPLFSTVKVEVATLPTNKLPNVVGLAIETAKDKLKEHGFGLGQITKTPNRSVADVVIKQEPEAGNIAEAGVKVRLWIAAPILVTVPNFVGQAGDLAKEKLVSLGLGMDEVTKPSSEPNQTVIEQQPIAGENVPFGSKVRLTISITTLPVAEAGISTEIEFGKSFTLDGSSSKPAPGKRITKYVWTQFN